MTDLYHAPALLSHEDLAAVLHEMSRGFLWGDTLEGFIEFTVEDDGWLVKARYRVGNREGQGSVRIVGEMIPVGGGGTPPTG